MKKNQLLSAGEGKIFNKGGGGNPCITLHFFLARTYWKNRCIPAVKSPRSSTGNDDVSPWRDVLSLWEPNTSQSKLIRGKVLWLRSCGCCKSVETDQLQLSRPFGLLITTDDSSSCRHVSKTDHLYLHKQVLQHSCEKQLFVWLTIPFLAGCWNYPSATPHLHDTTNKRDSESVWAFLKRKGGALEGLRKAPGVGGRAKQ